jgi:hypothetical protein
VKGHITVDSDGVVQCRCLLRAMNPTKKDDVNKNKEGNKYDKSLFTSYYY